jgi:hypothetical protein
LASVRTRRGLTRERSLGHQTVGGMGTRINVLFGHSLDDFCNPDEVLGRLASSAMAALAVRDYWISVGPGQRPIEARFWEADPVLPRTPGIRRFCGPGSLFLSVTACAVVIRTGGRWRGFLSIEPLRRVHLAAFRAIASALGADIMALYHDSDDINDLFWNGRSAKECFERMERIWGRPQLSVEAIDPRIAMEAEHGVPSVWFLERAEGC